MAPRLVSLLCVLLLIASIVTAAGFAQYPAALVLLLLAGVARSASLYRAYAWLSSHVIAAWLKLVAFLFEFGYGVRYVVYAEGNVDAALAACRDAAVLTSNHRTRLDWAFLWPLLARAGALSSLRIVLKSGLRWGPLFLGPAIQLGRYLFLHRRWEQDEKHATRLYGLLRYGPRLRGWCGSGRAASVGPTSSSSSTRPPPYCLLLFPEGTDLHPAARDKSWAFSDARGQQRLNYVLHPRTKGLAHALWCLAGQGALPTRGASTAATSADAVDGSGIDRRAGTIVDVTIAYEGGIPQNEACLAGITSVGAHAGLQKPAAGGPAQEAATSAAASAASKPARSSMPRAVHVHVRAWKVEEVAASLRHEEQGGGRGQRGGTKAGHARAQLQGQGQGQATGGEDGGATNGAAGGTLPVPAVLETQVEAWLSRRFQCKEVALAAFYSLEGQGYAPVLDLSGAELALQQAKGQLEEATALLVGWHAQTGSAGGGSGSGKGKAGTAAASPPPSGVTQGQAPSPIPWGAYLPVLAFFCLLTAAVVWLVRAQPKAVAAYLAGLTVLIYYLVPLVPLAPEKGGGLDCLELGWFGPVRG